CIYRHRCYHDDSVSCIRKCGYEYWFTTGHWDSVTFRFSRRICFVGKYDGSRIVNVDAFSSSFLYFLRRRGRVSYGSYIIFKRVTFRKEMEMLKERLTLLDKWIVIPFIILILFSSIAVYSASNYSAIEEFGNPNYYLVRQSIVVFISLFIAFFVYIFPFRVLKKKKTILFGTVVIFALLTIVFFLPARLGARRW